MSGALRRAFGRALNAQPLQCSLPVRDQLRDQLRDHPFHVVGRVRTRLYSAEGKSASVRADTGRLHTEVNVTPDDALGKRISPEVEQAIFSESPLIFDTHRMIAYLRQSGFSQVQSEAVTDAMVRVSQHANRHHQNQMVTKNEFVSLRSELSILEKADFALLKTDINAIEKRMETSVAEIYTAVERVENRVIKWVIAVAGAIGLAIIRLTTTSGGASSKPQPPTSNVADVSVPRVVRRDSNNFLVT